MEIGIDVARQQKPRDLCIKCRLVRVVLQLVEIGADIGRIEFDEKLARLHMIAVVDADRADRRRLERLHDLTCPSGTTLPAAVATMSICERLAQRTAAAMIVQSASAVRRSVGEAGVSTTSIAAGRKARSSAVSVTLGVLSLPPNTTDRTLPARARTRALVEGGSTCAAAGVGSGFAIDIDQPAACLTMLAY
jgi:hypothetical protein